MAVTVPETEPHSDARPARWRSALTAVAGVSRTAGIPVVVAFLVGAVVLLVTGHNPITVYGLLLSEAFSTPSRINATLTATTPLLFTAVAAAFAYRAGMFSVGAEGSFRIGGLTAAVIGSSLVAPGPLVIVAAILGGVIAGGVTALVPALLRARWNVDEVVTTLMFNFIAAGLASWLVQTYFLAPGQANASTRYVADEAQLAPLFPPGQLSSGIIIALAVLVGYALWMRHSALGYEFRVVGVAPRFAVAQGIRVRTVILTAIVGAGVIGGLGGSVYTLGLMHRYTSGFSAGFGFTGIAIALLARFNPWGILVGSILFGALNAAGATIQLFINIPIQLIDILEGTVMVLAVASFALPRLRTRKAER